jgi:hypothetical protein
VIQFASLSVILMALFTYISVYEDEWKEAKCKVHGMFWSVKAPIMVIFYFGDILLSILSYFNVITDRTPAHSGGTHWSAEAIKNGYYVLIICSTMVVVSILMQIYFGLDAKEYSIEEPKDGYFEAFTDGFLAYIPQFLKNVFMCGGDTVVLAKKRIQLRKDRHLSDDQYNLLNPDTDADAEIAREYLNQKDTDSKLYDEDTRHHHNFNALPLEPLTSLVQKNDNKEESSTFYKEETITAPAPPLQSRVVNHNDEISQFNTTRGSHFNPHDLERQ